MYRQLARSKQQMATLLLRAVLRRTFELVAEMAVELLVETAVVVEKAELLVAEMARLRLRLSETSWL